MTPDYDLDELRLVKDFRVHLAEVPPGLQARLEERMWQNVLAEETRIRGGRQGARRRARRASGWGMPTWLRQVAAAGAAAAIVSGLVITDQGLRDAAPATQQAGSGTNSVDPLSRAMRAIAGDEVTGAGEITASADANYRTAPLVAGTTTIVFEGGHEMPLSQVAAGPAAMPPDELSLLPADERALLGLLRAAAGRPVGHDPDFEPFRLAALYISDPRVPVPVRVALIRMLRVMDGLDVGGSAIDVFGRTGVVIARYDSASGLRQQYLLDEGTGQLLEHREYVAAQRIRTCPPGSVVAINVHDSSGFRMRPEQAPYANWPSMRPECDPAAA